jgi:hypothetical protein
MAISAGIRLVLTATLAALIGQTEA